MPNESYDKSAAEPQSADRQTSAGGMGRLHDVIDPLRNQAANAYATAQQRSAEAIEATENYIKQSPLKAVAYAAGIAALLGAVGAALLGRRNSSSRVKGPNE